MDRRSFIRLFSGSAIAATFDVEKLLWIPGEKTIFLPSVKVYKSIGYSEIVALQMEMMLPRIEQMFKRDDMFFKVFFDEVAKGDTIMLDEDFAEVDDLHDIGDDEEDEDGDDEDDDGETELNDSDEDE